MLVNHIRYTEGPTIYGMGDDKSIKRVLWQNVQALMVKKYGQENINALANDAKVGMGTIQRIKEARTSVGVEIIEKIADTFGVEAWQLLAPGLGDRDFLVILRAYRDTDGRGRRMLLRAAEGAAQDEPVRTDRPSGRAARS